MAVNSPIPKNKHETKHTTATSTKKSNKLFSQFQKKQTTDFTRGQQINVRNPLTGLWMPAVIAEKRQKPMSYDAQIGNRIIRRAHHHIRKAYTPPLHTPPPILDMSISNHAPIPSNTYSIPQSAPPPLPTAPPPPATLPQSAPPPLPTTPHHSPILTSHTLQVSL